MQYAVAMTVNTRSLRVRDLEQDKQRTSQVTSYIRALSRSDAYDMTDRLNTLQQDVVQDGPFEHTRTFEVVGYVIDCKGRGFYLSASEMEMIASEYTAPHKMVG